MAYLCPLGNFLGLDSFRLLGTSAWSHLNTEDAFKADFLTQGNKYIISVSNVTASV